MWLRLIWSLCWAVLGVVGLESAFIVGVSECDLAAFVGVVGVVRLPFDVAEVIIRRRR